MIRGVVRAKMVKTNLAITEHEDKTSKNGKDYTRFKTNNGWMSCFEEDVIKKIKENEGKIVCVETAESEQNGQTYKNIRGFIEVVAENKEVETIEEKPQVEVVKMSGDMQMSGSTDNKFTTMYVSYAKDIFNSICCSKDMDTKEKMKEAIELVKQAREAFI